MHGVSCGMRGGQLVSPARQDANGTDGLPVCEQYCKGVLCVSDKTGRMGSMGVLC